MFLYIFAVIILFVLVYYFLTSKYDYWKKKGISYVKPTIIFGNYIDYAFMRKNIGLVDADICKQFPEASLIGTYRGMDPALIVKDPELIKLVTTKDFYYFNGRELSEYIHKESVLKNLFSEAGDYWKVVRQNLTPLFSSAKLKKMFQLIEARNVTLTDLIEDEIRINDEHEIKQLVARYTMDCIGSCAFGVDTDAMGKNLKSNPFRKMADNILDLSFFRAFKLVARNLWPAYFYGLGFRAMPSDIADFFKDLLQKVFMQRDYKPSGRNDFIDSILIFKENNQIVGDAIENMKTSEERQKISIKVDDDLLMAQCFIFFAAGFETTASTLSFTLFELAKNNEAQSRALEEVDGYVSKHGGKLEYEWISELPYLEACIDEALRLYPVLNTLVRQVMEDYKFPSGLLVKKNTHIHIPIYYLQRCADFFPNPDEYQPERFLPGEKENIIPHTYMPFGEGPRTCIGLRFAKMVMLSGLVTILKRHRVELVEGQSRTIEFEGRAEGSMSKNGINLKLTPRQK